MIIMIAILLATTSACAAPNPKPTYSTDEDYVVMNYDSSVDYSAKMIACAQNGSEYAMLAGDIYEQQRNLKIKDLGYDYEETNYFRTYETGEQVLIAMHAADLKKEYTIAGEVYQYLRLKGYSDVTTAAILGNMMTECGGHTLNLQWNLYSEGKKYYGLCMWSLKYYPDIKGKTVTEQLDTLTSTITSVMSQFGGSFTYFKSITDAGEAARYFCTYYERGAGLDKRAQNAYKALGWIQ